MACAGVMSSYGFEILSFFYITACIQFRDNSLLPILLNVMAIWDLKRLKNLGILSNLSV